MFQIFPPFSWDMALEPWRTHNPDGSGFLFVHSLHWLFFSEKTMMSVDWSVLDLNNVSQPAERHGLKTLWWDLQKEVSVMVLLGVSVLFNLQNIHQGNDLFRGHKTYFHWLCLSYLKKKEWIFISLALDGQCRLRTQMFSTGLHIFTHASATLCSTWRMWELSLERIHEEDRKEALLTPDKTSWREVREKEKDMWVCVCEEVFHFQRIKMWL